MKEVILTPEEASSLIEGIGPRLGCDNTDEPIFPNNRKDVCVVRHSAENGDDYGFDTIYLVWKEPDGSIKHKEIKNSKSTKDHIHIRSVEINKDGVSVKLRSGGSFSGVPWSEAMALAISDGQAQVSKEDSDSFAEQAKQAMVRTIESHQHSHPLYKPTAVKESVIDEERNIAAFILFEQIDTDRHAQEDEGWLGDQFRYSLWKLENNHEPVQIYEDHAYIRSRTKSELTGTRGRDCSLKNLRIEDKIIKVNHFNGETVEEQEMDELVFDF